jgi:hypothetical protein
MRGRRHSVSARDFRNVNFVQSGIVAGQQDGAWSGMSGNNCGALDAGEVNEYQSR